MIDEIGRRSSSEGRPWSRLPTMSEQTRKSLIGTADFLALNYYTSRLVAPKIKSTESSIDYDDELELSIDETWKRGKSDWLYNVPEGLYDLLMWIKVKYENPMVIITENGFSDDGQLDDDGRIDYLKAHLASVSKAISGGCNVTGYTVWSIIDNFEWSKGYNEKFGIFAVNMTSEKKERTPKKSAEFVKQLITDNKFLL